MSKDKRSMILLHQQGTEGVKLFIGRIPKEAEEEQIRKVVEPFGEVVEVRFSPFNFSFSNVLVKFKSNPKRQNLPFQ